MKVPVVSFEVSRKFEKLVGLTRQVGDLAAVGAKCDADLDRGLELLTKTEGAFQMGIVENRTDELVGVLLFIPVFPSVMDVHVVFSRAYRGKVAISLTRKALSWLFLHSEINMLVAKCDPNLHRHVIVFGKLVGFRESLKMSNMVCLELTRDMVINNN